MSVKITEVSFSVVTGAEGHVNVTQTIVQLIPSIKAEQVSIDKRVFEDNEAIVYNDDEGIPRNGAGDIILEYKRSSGTKVSPLEITAIISH